MSGPPHPDVHEGRDGWLFLVGGTNRVLSQYRGTPLDWLTTARWAWRIARRRRRAAGLGIRYVHLAVPEKLTVYDDRAALPFDPRRGPAARLGALLSRTPAAPSWIDLVGAFRAARDAADLYKRTDSHWTWAGCRLALDAVARACAATADTSLAGRPVLEVRRVGDLGMKLDPPREEVMHDHFIVHDAVRREANDLVLRHEALGSADRLHAGARVVFRNEAAGADPRTVVLFGDSCAHFAPIGLTAMLAETFREVHFVWSASLDWDLIAAVRPQILIAETAERFLIRVPEDRYDTEADAAARLAALDAQASPAAPSPGPALGAEARL